MIATEEGKRPEPDPLQVSPDGVVFGALGASPDAKSCYYGTVCRATTTSEQ